MTVWEVAGAELEACDCPLCGAAAGTGTPYGRKPYRILRCPECRLWYLSPRPTAAAIARLYSDASYFTNGQAGYDDYRSQERSLRKTFRMLLQRLADAGATGGALLEVGSGFGYLLDEARPHFATRLGVELAPAAAHEAAIRAGVPVYEALAALDPAARFDCIVATHVIEHVQAPVRFAADLAERLRPGGVLVLAAPDMDSPLRRLMGNRWPSFKYPEHLAYFDQRTLPRLMAAAGLLAPERLAYPHAFPLGLILGKFGLPGPAAANRFDLTLPGTTVCFMARRPGETTQ